MAYDKGSSAETKFKTTVAGKPAVVSVVDMNDDRHPRMVFVEMGGNTYEFDAKLQPVLWQKDHDSRGSYLAFEKSPNEKKFSSTSVHPTEHGNMVGNTDNVSTQSMDRRFGEALVAIRSVSNDPKFPKDLRRNLATASLQFTEAPEQLQAMLSEVTVIRKGTAFRISSPSPEDAGTINRINELLAEVKSRDRDGSGMNITKDGNTIDIGNPSGPMRKMLQAASQQEANR